MNNQYIPNNVWIYSATSSGELRTQWQLSEDEFKTPGTEEIKSAQSIEDRAQTAIQELSGQVNEQQAAQARQNLVDYVIQSDSWRAATAKDWEIGMHFIVVDHCLPGGHVLLSTFSIPSSELLSSDQVAQLVNTLISGGGRCCT